MTKNNKILIGAAILAAGGYAYWKSKQPKKAYMNVQGKPKFKCPAGKQMYTSGENNFYCIDPSGLSPNANVRKVPS